jgi:MipA family protein
MLVMRCLASASVLSVIVPWAASAQDAAKTGWFASIPNTWTITLGVEGRASPAFPGSDKLEVEPVPVFSLRPEGKTARFRSVRDSASIALFDAGGFYAGPAGRFQKARNESDHDALRGLGDVDWTLEVGLFAEYWPTDRFRTRAELRRGFNGHEGLVADLSADVVVPFADRWTISGGPRMTLATAAALAPYFDIDAVQSARSGLAMYETKAGLKSLGVGAQVRYQWNPQWATRAYVEYERLMDDVAASPLVSERGSANQVTFGVGVSYSFDYRWR